MSAPDPILRLLSGAPASESQPADHRPAPPAELRALYLSAAFARVGAVDQARGDLAAELCRAIQQEQFVLHYQPQLDLRTGDILSVEALIRWNRPGHGLVLPDAFIPFAEGHDLIGEIDEWTIGAAAEQAVAWDRAGLPPFGIAVNISAVEFHGGCFVDRLAGILRRKRLASNRLELEITEGVIMRDCDAAICVLEQLRGLGVSLSIDDFGTGYTSLSDLQQPPAR